MSKASLEWSSQDGSLRIVLPGGSAIPLPRKEAGLTEEAVRQARVVISAVLGMPVGFVTEGRRTTSSVLFDVKDKGDCCG